MSKVELRGLKNFYTKNSDGRPSVIKRGEICIKDYPLDNESISQHVCDLQAFILDKHLVPPAAFYVVKYFFSRTIDGIPYKGEPKETISLPQQAGCELMARGLVRPKDPSAWYPFRPLELDDLITKQPKRMFDVFDGPKETVKNWVQGFKKND